MKLLQSLSEDSQKALKEAREHALYRINLTEWPQKRRFQHIVLRIPGRDAYPVMVGNLFEIRIRGKIRKEARLLSCVFRKIEDLTANDAIAEGFTGPGPLAQLKGLLTRRFKESPHWQREKTNIDILTFEWVG